MTIITFTSVAGAECRYARAPVAPYGTIGKGPRRQRLQQEAHAALESAIRELGEIHPWGPPTYLVSAGAMVPQSERRGPRDPHVRGLAIDIDSLWWGDGTLGLVAIDVPKRWRHYIAIQCVLARHFGVVLGHDYNTAHHDHWHCDVTCPVIWDAGSRMDTLLLQRALVEVWGESILIDGRYGPATRGTARKYQGDWREWLLATARRGLEEV
jgi:hypothetical protein